MGEQDIWYILFDIDLGYWQTIYCKLDDAVHTETIPPNWVVLLR